MLVAMALYGLTSTVVGMLGSNHVHRAFAEPVQTAVLEDFRRLDAGGSMAAAPHDHGHAHSTLRRHHHDATDRSVQAVDAAADDLSGSTESGATALGALALIASAALLMLAAPMGRLLRWTAAGRALIPSGHAHRLERPPRT